MQEIYSKTPMAGGNYNIDVVFVIDKTCSMTNIIEEVKRNTLKFRHMLEEKLEEERKYINMLRVKVITFGCIGEDGQRAFRYSDFYELPEEESKFDKFVSDIHAEGGGDESGLNALAMALQSKWTKGGKTRHIVIMFTDENSHELERHYKKPNCPYDAPANMQELDELWCGAQHVSLDEKSKRLIMFAPDNSYYSDIAQRWNRTYFYPQEYDKLYVPMEDIIRILVASISAQ